MSRIKCLIIAAVACFPSAALAQAFNFENLLFTPPFDVYSSLTQTIGSQTLTVTPVTSPGDNGFLLVFDPRVPLLGSVSIGANALPSPLGASLPMRFSFLNPVSSITFAFGDIGGDDDSPARIEAFDAFNNALGVFDTPYPAGKGDGATRTLTFAGAGASYFVVSSGSAIVPLFNPNSLNWEVAASTPTAAPEPASVALVGSGLALLGVAYRRRESRHRHKVPRTGLSSGA